MYVAVLVVVVIIQCYDSARRKQDRVLTATGLIEKTLLSSFPLLVESSVLRPWSVTLRLVSCGVGPLEKSLGNALRKPRANLRLPVVLLCTAPSTDSTARQTALSALRFERTPIFLVRTGGEE